MDIANDILNAVYYIMFQTILAIGLSAYGINIIWELIKDKKTTLKYDPIIWQLAAICVTLTISNKYKDIHTVILLIGVMITLSACFGYTTLLTKLYFKTDVSSEEIRTIWQVFCAIVIIEALFITHTSINIDAYIKSIDIISIFTIPALTTIIRRRVLGKHS